MRNEKQILYVLCALSFSIILFLLISSPSQSNDRKSILEYLEERDELRGKEELKDKKKEKEKEEEYKKEHEEREHRELNDPHIIQIDHSTRIRKEEYPRRQNMSSCPTIFGRIGVFVAYVKSSMETHYAVAQRSLECYLKSVNYTVFMVDLDNDERVKHACYKNKQLFFRKHCAASVYLKEVDWMLILDADTAIVNPNHCIEEWIDTRADLIFYERYFNWEVASGNYIAKNTEFSTNFLKKWADWEFIQPQNWNGADNGVLQIHILQAVIPSAVQEIKICDEIWHKGTDYDTYMAFVTCCKMAMGATRLWPGRVRIYRRAHGWVRDGFLASDSWAETDFMLHGYKAQKVGQDGWQSPFTEIIDVSKCDASTKGWPWRKEKMITVQNLRTTLANFEKSTGTNYPQKGRVIPYLQYPDVGDCFPHCDDMV